VYDVDRPSVVMECKNLRLFSENFPHAIDFLLESLLFSNKNDRFSFYIGLDKMSSHYAPACNLYVSVKPLAVSTYYISITMEKVTRVLVPGTGW
jgi:hypothetical protein